MPPIARAGAGVFDRYFDSVDPLFVVQGHSWTLTELGPARTRADNQERLSGPAVLNMTEEMKPGLAVQQQAIAAAFKEAAESGSAV